YLLVRTEPTASSTASDTKFSEAISSRLRCWRCASPWSALAISGSTAASLLIRRLLPSRSIEREDLVDPPGVPARMELRSQPGLENLDRGLARGDARAEREDVRVVVLAAHTRAERVATRRGAHAGQLVGGHRHPDARAAHEHAARGLAGDHRRADRDGVVGVIDRLGRLRAEVHDVVAVVDEPCLEIFLQGESRVIGAEAHDRHMGTISVVASVCQAINMMGILPFGRASDGFQRSICWRSAATAERQPSCRSIASRRAAAAEGSPSTQYVIPGGREKPRSPRMISALSASADQASVLMVVARAGTP